MRDPLVLRYGASDRATGGSARAGRRFERQLRLLAALGYRATTFSQALLAPTHNLVLAVTFDGADEWLHEHGARVLAGLGIPGTLFVTGAEASGDGWERVRALADAGWEIGSGPAGGAALTTLPASALAAELAGTRGAVEAALGRPCISIAYPPGPVDDRVIKAASAAGFRAGARSGIEPGGGPRDESASTRMRWRRVSVDREDPLARFGARVATATAGARGERAARSEAPDPGRREIRRRSPRCAVVIPCFNDGVLAREAVASVDEGDPVEIVVVDDASTEAETLAALAALEAEGVRVLRHDVNRGLSAARRTGLSATSAPYVLPLDADDLVYAGALTALADRLDMEPRAVAAWGDIVTFGTRDERGTTPVWLDPFRVAFRNEYPVCSLFRREALLAVGAWQDVGGQVGYEDWNLWMTFAERGDLAVHAGPGVLTGRYRVHGPRMLSDAAGRHRALYAELRASHPRLFADIAVHRRRSDLGPLSRFAYPLLFGSRPPLGLRKGADSVLATLRGR